MPGKACVNRGYKQVASNEMGGGERERAWVDESISCTESLEFEFIFILKLQLN